MSVNMDIQLLTNILETDPKFSHDVDDVIAEIAPVIVECINEELGTTYTVESYIESLSAGKMFLGMSFDELLRYYEKAWVNKTDTIQKKVEPSELSAFLRVNEGKVDLVTSRDEKTLPALEDWLSINYPENKFNIICTSGGDKSALDYKIYIDDAVRLAQSIANREDKFMFLVDVPNNRNFQDLKNVVRVSGAAEAYKIIEDAKTLSRVKT